MADTPAYYAVTVTNSGRRSLVWSRHFDSAGDARDFGRAEVEAGRATLSFVVENKGGVKRVLLGRTHPASAEKIIRHWIELNDSLE